MFYEGNQIHNFMSSSGSGTVINYGSGSGSDFLTSYGSSYGSGSTSQKVTVPTVPVPVPVPVPQHWKNLLWYDEFRIGIWPCYDVDCSINEANQHINDRFAGGIQKYVDENRRNFLRVYIDISPIFSRHSCRQLCEIRLLKNRVKMLYLTP